MGPANVVKLGFVIAWVNKELRRLKASKIGKIDGLLGRWLNHSCPVPRAASVANPPGMIERRALLIEGKAFLNLATKLDQSTDTSPQSSTGT